MVKHENRGTLPLQYGWEETDITNKRINKTEKCARLRLLVLAAVLFFCAGCGGRREAELLLDTETQEDRETAVTAAITPESTAAQEEAAAAAEIFVDVCGAVARPGVYGMSPDSRVFQAIEAAGGFLPEAAGTYINQAQTLQDGQQIYVPTEEEIAETDVRFPGAEGSEAEGGNVSGETASSGRVNLNTADAAALQTLTGIGEAKALAILAYREEHGDFQSIEDIMNVPGIKESTFSKIKDKIAIE